jgi:IPT/TIG domain
LHSFISVTLNGREKTAEKIIFSYYPELKITKVERNSGPVQGNTTSTLYGDNFAHPNICNLKVKYGAIDVNPKLVNDTIIVQSPKVGFPDAVTLFPSGNG